ncbi:hypothetical protein OC834_007926, partial [Tilletia horrida]
MTFRNLSEPLSQCVLRQDPRAVEANHFRDPSLGDLWPVVHDLGAKAAALGTDERRRRRSSFSSSYRLVHRARGVSAGMTSRPSRMSPSPPPPSRPPRSTRPSTSRPRRQGQLAPRRRHEPHPPAPHPARAARARPQGHKGNGGTPSILGNRDITWNAVEAGMEKYRQEKGTSEGRYDSLTCRNRWQLLLLQYRVVADIRNQPGFIWSD